MDREWKAWVNETLTVIEPHPVARVALTDRLRKAGELGFLYSAYTVGGGNRDLIVQTVSFECAL